jgi:NTE family protein
MLRDQGRKAADEFLSASGDDLGNRSSLDLEVILQGV